jgi:hypothetical protein
MFTECFTEFTKKIQKKYKKKKPAPSVRKTFYKLTKAHKSF